MYELQNSINWHMYFFKASGWCESFLFQNMHLFQCGSLTLLNNSWQSESWCHAYMTLVMIFFPPTLHSIVKQIVLKQSIRALL